MNHRKIIEENILSLAEGIELNQMLWEKLIEADLISRQDAAFIKASTEGKYYRVKNILNRIQQKDYSEYIKFREVLILLDQEDVVKKWLPEQQEMQSTLNGHSQKRISSPYPVKSSRRLGSELMSEGQRDNIEMNRSDIIKDLRVDKTLLDQLQSAKILSLNHAGLVQCKPKDTEKNTALLDYIIKISRTQLFEFTRILSKSQPKVAELFRYEDDECESSSDEQQVPKLSGIKSMTTRRRKRGHLLMKTSIAHTIRKETTADRKGRLMEEIELKLLELMKKSLDNLLSASNQEEEEKYKKSLEYFRQRRIEIKEIKLGSIIWTLSFSTVESLDDFWSLYMAGGLTQMLQQDYITPTFLEDLELESAQIGVSVNEHDFHACKDEVQALSHTNLMIKQREKTNSAAAAPQDILDNLTTASGLSVTFREGWLKIRGKKGSELARLSREAFEDIQEKLDLTYVKVIYMKNVNVIESTNELNHLISECRGCKILLLFGILPNPPTTQDIWIDLSLAHLDQLLKMDIRDTALGAAWNNVLSSISSRELRILCLYNNQLSGHGQALNDLLRKLPCLHFLGLNRSGLQGSELEQLLSCLPCSCPKLRGLTMAHNDLSEGGNILVKALEKLPMIRLLIVEDCQLQGCYLSKILQITNLPEIEILALGDNHEITQPNVFDQINMSTSLQYVRVTSDQISDERLAHFDNILQKQNCHLLVDLTSEHSEWKNYLTLMEKIREEFL